MTTGTIKKVVADRGFGFIAAEDTKEYFFHRGGLDSSLDFDRLIGGEKVEFEIERVPRARAPSRSTRPSRQEGPPGNGAGFFVSLTGRQVPGLRPGRCPAAGRIRRG